MTVLLVRHARAGRRSHWEGDDRDRPLSKRGRAQADALPEILAPLTNVGRRRPLLLSSPWARCIQTLAPLAATTKAIITEEAALGEGGGATASTLIDGWLSARPTVLCTHGDVVNDVLAYLSSMGVSLGAHTRSPKGSVWVLDGPAGSISTARYLPPPS